MKERTKYILMGVIIGIVIGMVIFYIFITFRIFRPFGLGGFRQFPRNNTSSNFPRSSIGE
jgi:hypothetical protein